MNAFDYFFEKTADLDKPFLAGKEEISFKQLYNTSTDPGIMVRKGSWPE